MNNGAIKIDRGIPLPKPRLGAYGSYPLRDMKKGDSFFIKGDLAEICRLRQAASQFARRNPPVKFATRKEGDGVRIWRTA